MSRTVVQILTVADSLIFIDELVRCAQRRGFEVVVVTSPDERLSRFGRQHQVRTFAIEMPRRVTPLGDWEALGRLRALLERLGPDIVHAHTPKGGLLGTLAASAVGVSVRLYHMRGLPYLTQRGVMRALMQTTERVACAAATRVICQSPSLRELAVEDRLVAAQKATVVLGGSNGVDSEGRFNPALHVGRRSLLRAQWGIPESARVVAFVGRLVRDKGVPELIAAFERLSAERGDLHLLVAGPQEERDGLGPAALDRLRRLPRVHLLGYTSDSAGVYAASDVVALPSHREGFPNVPLEAASMGLPVVSTRVPGCTDAVADGSTGLLVPVADAGALAEALARYLDDGALRHAHSTAGRERVQRLFGRQRLANGVVDLYESELSRAPAGQD